MVAVRKELLRIHAAIFNQRRLRSDKQTLQTRYKAPFCRGFAQVCHCSVTSIRMAIEIKKWFNLV